MAYKTGAYSQTSSSPEEDMDTLCPSCKIGTLLEQLEDGRLELRQILICSHCEVEYSCDD